MAGPSFIWPFVVDILLGSSVIEPLALSDESGLTAEEWPDLGPTSHS